MVIQKNQTQESFEKLYVKNAPAWSLERDQNGGYKYHATQSAFLLFEQQQVEIDLLKNELAKAQVPEGFVLVPKEPTPKMIDSTWHHDDEIQEMSHNTRNEFIYKTMIEVQEQSHEK